MVAIATFSGLEAGLLSLNSIWLSEQAGSGNKRAKTVQEILRIPSRMIAVMLTMETTGVVVLTVLWTIVAKWSIQSLHWPAWSLVGFEAVLVLVLVTFCEIIPKAIFATHTEKLSLLFAPITYFLIRVIHPFAAVLEWTAKILIRLLTGKWAKPLKRRVTEEGLLNMVIVGEDEGVIRCFERREHYRYPIYWQYRGDVNKRVKNLILNQDGVLMRYDRASELLNELLDRVEVVRRGSETDTTETIKRSYEQLLIRNNPLEIKVRIEEERSRYLDDVRSTYDSVGQNPNWQTLWDAHVKLIEKASRIIIFAEQLLRLEMSRDWEELIKTFEEIHSINKDQDRYGRNGLINYLFFSLFFVIGSRALRYERFAEIKKLLSMRKLYRDRLEYLLDWNIQASYLEERNQSEPQRYYVPKMHYLLGLVEANKFPIDKDELRNSILEFDLLCFIYTAKPPKDKIYPYWCPRCVYYFKHETPHFLQKIKIDDEYCEKIARHLFNETKDVLRTSFVKVDEVYVSLSKSMEGWPEDPFKTILRK